MIKKYKIKKILLLAIFITLLTTANIDEVIAGIPSGNDADFGGIGLTTNQGNNAGGGGGTPPKPTGTASKDYGNGITAKCEWYISVIPWSWVYIKSYDMNGKKINDSFNIEQSIREQGLESILAGTYIGLDVYEEKGYSVSSRYEVSATKSYWDCYKSGYWATNYSTCPKDANGNYIYSQCKQYWVPANHFTNTTGGCPTGYKATYKTDPYNTTGDMESWCAEKAKPNVSISVEPSYKVSYKDPNDIDAPDLSPISASNDCEDTNTSDYSFSKSCTFHYNFEDACINVKNGKIRYISKSDNCSQDGTEYKISSNEKFWKYFIPLNATSNEGFSFTMQSTGSKQSSSDICKNIIEKYDNYKDMIKDQNNTEFTAEDTKGSAKRKVENGCYYQTIITIPIEQKFYNEVNGTTLKGFNFYYKPIEITDPFPNGLTDTSLWHEWDESNKKEPDLTKSYNEVTYIAQISNVNTIREYTQDYPYTTWSNMYTNGISSFIEKEGIVKRLTDKNKIYALGCGPWNENKINEDGSENVFYQPECDNS